MVQVLQVGDYTLNEETLDLALEEYQNIRETSEYGEDYKWEVFENLNEWVESNEITEDNVEEFVEVLQDENPADGPFAHWMELDDLSNFVEDNPQRAAELINQLYYGDGELYERMSTFRENLSLGSPTFGFLMAAYDLEKYAPFKQRTFQTFLEYFSDDEELPSLSGLSVSEKYDLYINFLYRLRDYISEQTDLESSALTAQDLIYCTTTAYSSRNQFKLKALHTFAKKMDRVMEDENKAIEEISDLPESYLEVEKEKYAGGEKVRRIRYEILDRISEEEEVDLESLIAEVNSDYDKNIVQNWSPSTIIAQLYLDYYKRRHKAYVEDLEEYLKDEMGKDKLDSHSVDFQGAQNQPASKCWIVLYPASKDSHTESFQYFLRVDEEGIHYGLDEGSRVRTEEDLPKRHVNESSDFSIQDVVEELKENESKFNSLNEGGDSDEVEKPEEKERYDEIANQLERESQVVFYGPPGTGKTYTARNFAKWYVMEQNEGADPEKQVKTVTFHPSFSYEDFIEGLTAKKGEEGVEYRIEKGIFREMCKEAREAYEEADTKGEAPNYVLIIDEINRGNLPKIFGEIITLIEDDKRIDADNEMSTDLAHSGEKFRVPPNLKIIGTMNTADRSIALVDAAIRRRFRFLHFSPNYEVIYEALGFEGDKDLWDTVEEDNKEEEVLQALSVLALQRINQNIIKAGNLGKGKQIGHSYLLNRNSKESIVDAWRYEILPLIEEYYFSQFDRMRREVFENEEVSLIDWDKEEIQNFDAEELRETLENLVVEEE